MADISKRQYGKDYSENLIDYQLSFNNNQTWTASSGTGSATIDVDNYFYGTGSLKIQNTDPENDLVVTNASQSTLIDAAGSYNFSFYALKSEVDEFIEIEVKVFKDAVLHDTQSFVLGSEETEEDLNDVWVRFMSLTPYDLIKGEVLTFTFNVKGKSGTSLLNTNLWIDGLMISKAERISKIPPNFTKPDRFKNLPDLPTADGDYKLTVSGGDYSWELII